MTTATITEFRNHIKEYFDSVEAKGEKIMIIRNGKPIAEVSPVEEAPAEKKPTKRVKLGFSLSDELLKDRHEGLL
jgi:prevent-host-death family protein